MSPTPVVSTSEARRAPRTALPRGGEWAELFREGHETPRPVLDDRRVADAVAGVDQGAGIRVVRSDRTDGLSRPHPVAVGPRSVPVERRVGTLRLADAAAPSVVAAGVVAHASPSRIAPPSFHVEAGVDDPVTMVGLGAPGAHLEKGAGGT